MGTALFRLPAQATQKFCALLAQAADVLGAVVLVVSFIAQVSL
jgi:hypothetical protein